MSIQLDPTALAEIETLSGSLADRVYESMRSAILSLAIAPGTVLRKGLICERLGVSRSPVSEAIARLSVEGLVDVIPQSATRVSRFSMDEIREAVFLREALELAAVAKVARDHTDEDIARLSRNLRLQSLLVEDRDYTGFYQADQDFHELIMSCTGYKSIGSVTAQVSLQLTRARLLLLPTPGRANEAVEEHSAILDAIRKSDPGAAQAAMRTHLVQLIDRLEPLRSERPELFSEA